MRRRSISWALAGVVAAVLMATAAPTPARAASPGVNGLLAVQPVAGGGIVTVRADGAGAHRICLTRRCGRASDPTWSPDGRELMVTTPAIRIIYPDGSCLDCQFGSASDPAFEPGGTLVSFLKDGALRIDGIDDMPRAVPSITGITAATWSVDGGLAVVRRGEIWAGSPARLMRIAAGSDPSWSPNARTIVAVERGWIVLLDVRNHQVRRLTPGTAPTFSPDGRSIAFIGRGDRVEVISATSAHQALRPVGHIRGVTVDWEAQPSAGTPACRPPPDSYVVASNAGGLLTGATNRDASPNEPFAVAASYMGCQRSDGRERLLLTLGVGTIDGTESVTGGAVAAPYAALAESSQDYHYDEGDQQLAVFDLNTGQLIPSLGNEWACGSCEFNDIAIGNTGATATDTFYVDPVGTLSRPLDALACAPGGSPCAALDGAQAFEASNPLGGPDDWNPAPLPATNTAGFPLPPGIPADVACPTTMECVGVSFAGVWTRTMSDGPWTAGKIAGASDLNGVACPTATLCVAPGGAVGEGNVAVTTDPGAGAGAWTDGPVSGASGLADPVCAPDGSVCAATSGSVVSGNSAVFVSSDPEVGASSWHVGTGTPYISASCPVVGFCAAIATKDNSLMTMQSPGAPSTTSTPNTFSLNAISCASASFCAAVGPKGALLTSTDPAAGQWTPATIDLGRDLLQIDCSSASDCIATDSTGHVVTSTDPTGGPVAWTPELIDGNPCNDTTPCAIEQIAANDGHGVRTVVSTTTAGSAPILSDLAISGDAVSWDQQGTPMSASIDSSPEANQRPQRRRADR